MLLHGSASILRDCTFECVDLRQLSAGSDRGRPSHPIYPELTNQATAAAFHAKYHRASISAPPLQRISSSARILFLGYLFDWRFTCRNPPQPPLVSVANRNLRRLNRSWSKAQSTSCNTGLQFPILLHLEIENTPPGGVRFTLSSPLSINAQKPATTSVTKVREPTDYRVPHPCDRGPRGQVFVRGVGVAWVGKQRTQPSHSRPSQYLSIVRINSFAVPGTEDVS